MNVTSRSPITDGTPFCVESQEWTYGLDNTGTRFNDTADYEIELSDGSVLNFSQTAQTGWSNQLLEWATNIQAAADAAGLQWFVDARFRNPSAPTDLAGGGGLSGPPSEQVSLQLTNMLWRYVNIQICPGVPVPVRMSRVSSGLGMAVPYDLTTDGPVLGPLQKFWMCIECDKGVDWYAEDGKTELTPGQIPNCWLPCGILQQLPSPPGAVCTFVFDIGCDDAAADPSAQVTRRVKFCDGEEVEVEYFVADPTDATALVSYAFVGTFVDCDSGVPLDEPVEPEVCTLADLAEECVVKCSALVSTGRGGINTPGTTDFALGAIGPYPTLDDLISAAADRGIALSVNTAYTADGSQIADASRLCVSGTDTPGPFTYTSAAAVAVTVDLVCETEKVLRVKLVEVEKPSVEEEPEDPVTVTGCHVDLAPGQNQGFIGAAGLGSDVRSITVHVVSEPVVITDGKSQSITYPKGSFTWGTSGDAEETNGLLRAVSVPAGSSGRAIVQYVEKI